MEPASLKDRTDRLFGRAADIERLCQRTRSTGLTAVIGRPMIGKSWLLEEVARRLASGITPDPLVGFSRNYGNPDNLLRAVSDLYQRWLADEGAWQKVRMAWTQQKDRLLPAFAGFLGKLAKDVAGVPGAGGTVAVAGAAVTGMALTKPAGTAIDEAIKGLLAVRETLQSGGLLLPPLAYEQARELLNSVATISSRPVVLVMDQWEAASSPESEAVPLRQFLRDAEDWPACHILLATSTQNLAAVAAMRKLADQHPGYARVDELTEMAIDGSEQRRLADFIRDRVPAAWDLKDEAIAGRVEGFPGVVDRWTRGNMPAQLKTHADLARVAQDAQAQRFPELEILDALKDDQLRAAVRIAALPSVQDPGTWDALRPIVTAGLAPDALDRLRLGEMLQHVRPPSFGHPKRAEAALRRLLDRHPGTLAAEAERLILALAGEIQSMDESVAQHASALMGLRGVAASCDLSPLPQALCESAATIFRQKTGRSEILIAATRDGSAAQHQVLFVLAAGLFNTLNDAKAEDHLPRRDALLEALRALAAAHPDDAPVREQLAKGLVNTQYHAKAEDDLPRRDALLEWLRALAAAHPEDAPVREWLARGLFNTLNDAKAEDDLPRRDALLEALRALAAAHPDDAPVREQLAKGLVNTQYHAKAEDDLPRRDALLEALRALAAAHPEDAPVREWLAKGLFNTLCHAKAEHDLRRRDALLEGLRALAAAHPEDAPVRERLAAGLFNTLNDAKAEDDLPRRDALLEALRALAAAHPEDALVRERLAKGLFNTLNDAEGDPQREAELGAELRSLVARDPANPLFGEVARALQAHWPEKPREATQ